MILSSFLLVGFLIRTSWTKVYDLLFKLNLSILKYKIPYTLYSNKESQGSKIPTPLTLLPNGFQWPIFTS